MYSYIKYKSTSGWTWQGKCSRIPKKIPRYFPIAFRERTDVDISRSSLGGLWFDPWTSFTVVHVCYAYTKLKCNWISHTCKDLQKMTSSMHLGLNKSHKKKIVEKEKLAWKRRFCLLHITWQILWWILIRFTYRK